MSDTTQLSTFINDVCSNSKYAMLSKDLVSKIAIEEFQNKGNRAKALKSTRTRLHRLAGAFIPSNIDYAKWLSVFKDLPLQMSSEHLTSLKQIMRLHASTAERLPYLDEVYKDIFSHMPSPSSILDLACGLNPLAIPWMPIDEGTEYHACDIVLPMLDFLENYFSVFRPNTHIFEKNILEFQSERSFDLIMLLKTMPLLAQIDKTAPEKLFSRLNFKYLLISYPLQSLGKQYKGMEKTYRTQFENLIANKPFQVQEYKLPNELFFILSHHD